MGGALNNLSVNNITMENVKFIGNLADVAAGAIFD